jgi:phosphatidylcholine synthase
MIDLKQEKIVEQHTQASIIRKMLAWSVHLFTGSGVVFALLGIVAVQRHQWKTVLILITVACLVDAVDGTLARAAQVKQVLPGFDGHMLDYVIDFLNFVVIPALFLYEANLLPDNVALATCALILLVSAYHYGNANAVTTDYYFEGFPAWWLLVAPYLFLLNLGQWLNLIVVLVFCILIFVPIKYVYISRTKMLRRLTWALTIIWIVICGFILLQLPMSSPLLVWISLLYPAYIFCLGIYRTLQR